MNIPHKPRFEHAKHIGRTFYNSLNIKSYPIDPIQIVYHMNWKFEIDDLCGEEGYTFYNPRTDNYCIVIDNTQSVRRQRCKFTIAHEIGHIVMDHYNCYDIDNLTDEAYHILDVEADIVAGEILMPYISLRRTNNSNIISLANLYDVSHSAMETRLRFLNLYDCIIREEMNSM